MLDAAVKMRRNAIDAYEDCVREIRLIEQRGKRDDADWRFEKLYLTRHGIDRGHVNETREHDRKLYAEVDRLRNKLIEAQATIKKLRGNRS